MKLCGGIGIVLLFFMAVLRKKSFWQKIRSPCRIIFLFCILGFLSEALSSFGTNWTVSGEIAKHAPGEGEFETEASIYLTDEQVEYPIVFTIPERKYTKAKEVELLAKAKKEIEETFCGANTSLEEIVSNPEVYDTYQNGAVSAEWIFSDNEIISSEGEIDQQAFKHSKETNFR